MICVYNKIDKLENIKLSFVPLEDSDSNVVARVYLSAQNSDSLAELYQALATFFNKAWINQTIELPPKYSKIRSNMYELDVVDKEEISEQGNYLLQIKISEDDFEKFNRELNLNLAEFFTQK